MIKAEWTNKDSLDLQPTCNQLATTSPSLADVYKWERDIALSQLEEYGIGFAEKKRDDLVEVVRCKDCKRYISERNECTFHDLMLVYPEFYCRSGKRKGGDTE